MDMFDRCWVLLILAWRVSVLSSCVRQRNLNRLVWKEIQVQYLYNELGGSSGLVLKLLNWEKRLELLQLWSLKSPHSAIVYRVKKTFSSSLVIIYISSSPMNNAIMPPQILPLPKERKVEIRVQAAFWIEVVRTSMRESLKHECIPPRWSFKVKWDSLPPTLTILTEDGLRNMMQQ